MTERSDAPLERKWHELLHAICTKPVTVGKRELTDGERGALIDALRQEGEFAVSETVPKLHASPQPVASRYMLTAIGDGARQVDAGWAYSDDPTRGEPLYALGELSAQPCVAVPPEAVRWAERMKHHFVEPDTRAAADFILRQFERPGG